MEEQADINLFLNSLEKNYFEFSGMFNFDCKEFLSIGDELLEKNTLPELDIPLTALEYLKFRSK